MTQVRTALTVPGTVHEAQTLWYETARWASWIDGLAHVAAVEGPWPEAGARVVWDSYPAGRGRVVERVVAHEALAGQTLEVEDESVRGRQAVEFSPVDGSVHITLTLRYELKRRSIVTPLLDVLFIRRAMAASLRSTLTRFGVELAAEREPGCPG